MIGTRKINLHFFFNFPLSFSVALVLDDPRNAWPGDCEFEAHLEQLKICASNM